MKKNVIVLLALCLFVACKTLPLQQPAVSILSVEVAGIDINKVELLCKVQVVNINSFEIHYPEVAWDFIINSQKIASGVFHDQKRIAANQTTIVEIPISVEHVEIFTALPSLKGTAETNYKINLAPKFSASASRSNIPRLEASGTIPLLQAPKFGASVLKVEKIENNHVEWYVSVSVENHNSFELPRPKYIFTYEVYETPIMRRSLEHRQQLAPRTSTPVIFGLIVYFADVHRALPAFRSSYELPCTLKMKFDYSIPAFSEDEFTLQIEGILPMTR